MNIEKSGERRISVDSIWTRIIRAIAEVIMLQFPLRYGEPPADAQDITAFENEADIQLPESYKQFLGMYNGGFFVDAVGIDVGDRFVRAIGRTEVTDGASEVAR